MGTLKKVIDACCDSGPFIHLAQVNLLKVFSLFQLYTTPYVIFEITKGSEPGIDKIPSWENLKIKALSQKEINALRKKLSPFKLHEAEMSVIALCKALNVALFLSDDMDTREAAQSAGLEVHGSAGMILKAFRNSIITVNEAENGIIDLYEKSSLFITRGIILKALSQLKKHS